MAVGLFVLAGTSEGRMKIAAEAAPIHESGPDQVAKPPSKPDIAEPAVVAKLNTCKAQWTTADSNGDGIIDGAEVGQYNTVLRAQGQPVLADTARLTETDFLTACTTLDAHE